MWLFNLVIICGILQEKVIVSHKVSTSRTAKIVGRHYEEDVPSIYHSLNHVYNKRHYLKPLYREKLAKSKIKLKTQKNSNSLTIIEQRIDGQHISSRSIYHKPHIFRYPRLHRNKKTGLLKMKHKTVNMTVKQSNDFIQSTSNNVKYKELDKRGNTVGKFEVNVTLGKKIDNEKYTAANKKYLVTQNCPSDGFFPDLQSCNTYHSCLGGKDHVFQCVKHFVYDHKNKTCIKKNHPQDCVRFRCNKRFKSVAYEGDANIYSLCQERKPTIIFRCPNDLIFYEISQSCLPKCHATLLADPEDCTKFYKCEKKFPISNRCPSHHRFDAELGHCTSTDLYKCSKLFSIISERIGKKSFHLPEKPNSVAAKTTSRKSIHSIITSNPIKITTVTQKPSIIILNPITIATLHAPRVAHRTQLNQKLLAPHKFQTTMDSNYSKENMDQLDVLEIHTEEEKNYVEIDDNENRITSDNGYEEKKSGINNLLDEFSQLNEWYGTNVSSIIYQSQDNQILCSTCYSNNKEKFDLGKPKFNQDSTERSTIENSLEHKTIGFVKPFDTFSEFNASTRYGTKVSSTIKQTIDPQIGHSNQNEDFALEEQNFVQDSTKMSNNENKFAFDNVFAKPVESIKRFNESSRLNALSIYETNASSTIDQTPDAHIGNSKHNENFALEEQNLNQNSTNDVNHEFDEFPQFHSSSVYDRNLFSTINQTETYQIKQLQRSLTSTKNDDRALLPDRMPVFNEGYLDESGAKAKEPTVSSSNLGNFFISEELDTEPISTTPRFDESERKLQESFKTLMSTLTPPEQSANGVISTTSAAIITTYSQKSPQEFEMFPNKADSQKSAIISEAKEPTVSSTNSDYFLISEEIDTEPISTTPRFDESEQKLQESFKTLTTPEQSANGVTSTTSVASIATYNQNSPEGSDTFPNEADSEKSAIISGAKERTGSFLVDRRQVLREVYVDESGAEAKEPTVSSSNLDNFFISEKIDTEPITTTPRFDESEQKLQVSFKTPTSTPTILEQSANVVTSTPSEASITTYNQNSPQGSDTFPNEADSEKSAIISGAKERTGSFLVYRRPVITEGYVDEFGAEAKGPTLSSSNLDNFFISEYIDKELISTTPRFDESEQNLQESFKPPKSTPTILEQSANVVTSTTSEASITTYNQNSPQGSDTFPNEADSEKSAIISGAKERTGSFLVDRRPVLTEGYVDESGAEAKGPTLSSSNLDNFFISEDIDKELISTTPRFDESEQNLQESFKPPKSTPTILEQSANVVTSTTSEASITTYNQNSPQGSETFSNEADSQKSAISSESIDIGTTNQPQAYNPDFPESENVIISSESISSSTESIIPPVTEPFVTPTVDPRPLPGV